MIVHRILATKFKLIAHEKLNLSPCILQGSLKTHHSGRVAKLLYPVDLVRAICVSYETERKYVFISILIIRYDASGAVCLWKIFSAFAIAYQTCKVPVREL